MALGRQLLRIGSPLALYVLKGICACKHVESSSVPPITVITRGLPSPGPRLRAKWGVCKTCFVVGFLFQCPGWPWR